MNKMILSLSAALMFTSAFAAAENGSPLPVWNHANDAGPIAGLQEVRYEGVKPAAKDDDRTKFIYPNAGRAADNNEYRLLGRTESR